MDDEEAAWADLQRFLELAAPDEELRAEAEARIAALSE